MRVAAVQLTSTADKHRNWTSAAKLTTAAAGSGAELVVLPEMFNVLGPPDVLRQGAEPLEGPTLAWARDLARRLGIWLLAGSITERVENEDKNFNTSCLLDPDGQLRAVYRKLHLFDVEVPGATFQESRTMLPGREVGLAGVGTVRLGLSICYDLRFPELFRMLTLAGARAIALPAAFLERTGRDHWEPLLRARAIENQVFVVAANQVGSTPPAFRWYGRSMIVDPWGIVLAQAPDQETYIVADLDLALQERIREQLPCLKHRRPEIYRWPDERTQP